MRIVLHESPDPRQARQRTGCLVPMDNTKLCHPDRELLVTSIPRIKDYAVSWAVHWLQRPFLLLDVERKHVVLVVLPVSRGFPEFAVIHIRRNNWGLAFRSVVCSFQ